MKCSVVINTYNRLRYLHQALCSLEYLRYPELEVIVVNGPSTDSTREYLEGNWAGAIKICACNVANISASRNVGVANASGDIIVFIDDDGVPEPDWLDQLVIAYRDPKVGAAGGFVRDHTGVAFQTRYIISNRDSTSQINIEDPACLPACQPHAKRFPGLIGVNSSFRRSALLEVGGFDEEYVYLLDETDVIARMIDKGYEIRIVPQAEVHHKYAPSNIRDHNRNPRSLLQSTKSVAYFCVRNATPDVSLLECFELVERQKQQLRAYTQWMRFTDQIDVAGHDRLLAEIDEGARTGVSDAFCYPARRLLLNFQPADWLDFPTRLEAGSRLRLAFVTALYPPRPCGGVAVFIHHLARSLAAAGHEITIITQAAADRGHTVDFEEGVWVHRLPKENIPAADPVGLPDLPSEIRWAAGRVLAELDRVNSHRRFQYVIGTIWDLDLAAVIASGRYPVAMYLVTSYRLMVDSKPEWARNRAYYEGHVLKMIRAEAWALQKARRILASSNAILRDVEDAYGLPLEKERVTLLPFGVPGPQQFPDRQPDGRVRLLYVGRFEYRKGADLLLAALPGLLNQHQDLEAICIGDNTLAGEDGQPYTTAFLSRHAEAPWRERISFRGHVSEAELERAYADCDFFVAPSRYESFGLIYLEAMRYGKPCIGCDVGGIPEIVQDGTTGLLIPPGDVDALARAIDTLASDSECRERLGRAARKRFEESFSVERFAESFERLARDWVSQEMVPQPPEDAEKANLR